MFFHQNDLFCSVFRNTISVYPKSHAFFFKMLELKICSVEMMLACAFFFFQDRVCACGMCSFGSLMTEL